MSSAAEEREFERDDVQLSPVRESLLGSSRERRDADDNERRRRASVDVSSSSFCCGFSGVLRLVGVVEGRYSWRRKGRLPARMCACSAREATGVHVCSRGELIKKGDGSGGGATLAPARVKVKPVKDRGGCRNLGDLPAYTWGLLAVGVVAEIGGRSTSMLLA
jgi:hypothetical protein